MNEIKLNEEYLNLLAAIPGGIAIYCSTSREQTEVVCFNDEVCNITGYSREEINNMNVSEICMAIKEDLPKVEQAIREAVDFNKKVKIIYHTKTKRGEIKTIQLSASIVSQDNKIDYTYVVYTDITEQEKQKNAMELQNEEIQQIYSMIPTGVFRCKNESGWPVIYANNQFYNFLGYTKKEFSELFQNEMVRVIYREDISQVADTTEGQLLIGDTISNQNRIVCKDGSIKWIDIRAKRNKEKNGGEYLYCVFADMTEQKNAEKKLKKSQEELSALIDNVPGGVFKYDADSDQFNFVSENMIAMLGYTQKEFTEKFNNQFSNMIYIDDRERVIKEINEQISAGTTDHCEYRIETKSGELRWFYDESKLLKDDNGKNIFYVVIVDMTEQKKAEEALRTSEEKFRISTENSDISFWTYDFASKAIIQTNSSIERHGFERIVKNVPQSLIECGHIRKDSAEAFLKMYEDLANGAKTASGDFWIYDVKKQQWWCEHIDYTNMLDDDGNPLKAYAVGKDVTATKISEQKFKEEAAYANAVQSENLLVKVRSNVTQNVVESYIAKDAVGISTDGMLYTVGAEALAATGFTEEEQDMIRSYLNRERVLKSFAEGDTTYSIDYRRKLHDGRVIWVNTTVKSYQNPETGDIMSFMYTYDINDDKIKDGIINAVTSLEYDYIAYIDLKSDKFNMYIGGENYFNLIKDENASYEQSVYDINNAIVAPNDLDRSISDMIPNGIRNNLKNQKVFSTVYSVYNDNKTIRQKRVQYAYLDEASEQVVCTRTDVTDLLEHQKQQENMLEAALLAAKQANSAKSNFLSRMSHEIRTPMNAIIGMSTIAAQAIGDDAQVADCIGKIGISSRFLLSLINDILDMSRIESGKMLLKSEKIPFEEFLNGINSICYTQAAVKDIDYENIVDADVDDYYIGDAMKLQQIVINIVSNAIKFTPHCGKVSLCVHQLKKDKNCATIRFVVNDTGCGISEEFIAHLFDPFAQEHSGTTSMYGGTGLGLAICKNLVDMMDGQINVRSIVGTGTEFTVDVKLGITEESRTRYLNKPNYNFEQLKALVVDDDVMVCEDAVITLKEIGVTSEWVDSGRKAVARVREKWESKTYYDLVLIDWKMPEMDGIETARQIRKIVGPDVTIIIMTAYDWASIENEAKLAGVNLLMSKPMFKSSLISAFQKALGKQVEQATEIKEDFQFDGKRILLAEDHPLNVEVAKRLLERKGFAVDVAENGLRTLEMFATTPEDYYDAILMDIRMPQMDGLQAANAIRHLTKKESKTIPIIAMTANAFDEDIQKSKVAGMNAHLAKPIEPQQMYQTLFDFIYGKDNQDE